MEQVEWAKLYYSYGEPVNVSELIQTIAFGDEAEARTAYSALDDNLVHQASVYSSTCEALPFLIEALALIGGHAGGRRGVLALIEEIISSSVHWIEMDRLSVSKFEEGLTLPKEIILRAWQGSDLFAHLLEEKDSFAVRTYGAYLLGLLLTVGPRLAPAAPPDRYAAAVATLTERLQSDKEVDELALSSIVFALGRAALHAPSLIELLRITGAKPNVGEPTRVAAALSVLEIEDGKHANLHEVDLVVDTMCRAEKTDGLYGGSPWIETRLRVRLCKVLCAWSVGDEDRMERVLPALLTGIRLTSGYKAATDLYPIFHWLWPDRYSGIVESPPSEPLRWVRAAPVTPNDLSDIGRRVVQACYDNPSIWEPPVGNTDWTFSDVGLPETRAGLKNLLDGTARWSWKIDLKRFRLLPFRKIPRR
jgi:hypothetical protein